MYGIKKVCFSLLILFAIIIFLSAPSFYTPVQESAKEVIRKADQKMRGETSIAEMTIQTVRPSWSREMKMKAWSKGTEYAMILVTAPPREKGTAFLKRGNEVWNWVPSIERVIKLPPSMMTQSWMGTDFTNDDLVRESSVVEDYTHSFAGDSVILGRDSYKIKLIPHTNAPVVWGMIMVWIDKKDYLQLRAEFYDEENMLISTMQASDIKEMGGRLIPSRLEMIPADKKNQKTVMIYNRIVFNKPISDSFFTASNMKNPD